MKKGLSSAQLKCVAVIAMIIDHTAWVFVPATSVLGFVMHFIGRFTGPTMFFFVAEGYKHTKSVNDYIKRLLIFGVISQIPYSLAFGYSLLMPLNIMFTLALGLWALDFCNNSEKQWRKAVCLTLCCLVSLIMDWYFCGILLIIIFSKENRKIQNIFFAAIVLICILMSAETRSAEDAVWSLYNLGMFIPLIALRFYNGERGKVPGGRWGFYAVYPAHLAILAVLRYILL